MRVLALVRILRVEKVACRVPALCLARALPARRRCEAMSTRRQQQNSLISFRFENTFYIKRCRASGIRTVSNPKQAKEEDFQVYKQINLSSIFM